MRVLIVGDYQSLEFAAARDWLRRHTSATEANTVAAALEILRGTGSVPRTIILAQSRPGQLSLADVDRLSRFAPLARLVGLLGSWCEGETRSGRPWPGVPRVYWHQWQPRLLRELSSEPLRSLPRTATAAEQLFQLSAEVRRSHGLVAIRASQRVTYETLAEALMTAGYSAVWIRPGETGCPPRVIGGVLDATNCDPVVAAEIAEFSHLLQPAPVLTLLGYPRQDEVERALSAGAAAVLAKPFFNVDLLGELARLCLPDAAAPLADGGRSEEAA